MGVTVLLTDTSRTPVLTIDYSPFGEATLTGIVTYNPRLPGQYHDELLVRSSPHANFLTRCLSSKKASPSLLDGLALFISSLFLIPHHPHAVTWSVSFFLLPFLT